MSDTQAYARALLGLSPDRPMTWADALGPPAKTQDEADFQKTMTFDPAVLGWRQGFSRKYGEQPNLNDPSYDYRAAIRSGARPAPYEHDAGAYHWPSSTGGMPLKAANHPTAWMETFMQAYGVDPHAASPEQMMDAYQKGIIPGFGLR